MESSTKGPDLPENFPTSAKPVFIWMGLAILVVVLCFLYVFFIANPIEEESSILEPGEMSDEANKLDIEEKKAEVQKLME